jgi:hypothetical protein
VALTASIAAAEPFGYVAGDVAGGEKGLLRIDLATGELSPIGPFGRPGAQVWALALAPGGALYGVDNAGSPRLIRIDAATGAAQVVADLDVGEPFFTVSGLTFDACGRLFATATLGVLLGWRDPLLEIDPATGAMTELSPPGSDPGIFSIAARGEELFVWTAAGLSWIDPETHLPVPVGPVPDEMGGPLDFDSEGGLWGYGLWPPGTIPDPPPHVHLIHQIDPETGATGEPVATLPSIHAGLAIALPAGACVSGAPLGVPALSPGGLAVLVLSLLGLGTFLLRRGAENAEAD